MSTGMLIDGVAASEAIDSSGEILSVEGCDISELPVSGVLNWEHRGEESPGHSPSDVVGKIVRAKKIFSEKDCENDREKMYWEKVRLPYIYIVARLYDGAGHQAASDMAAQIRDHAANDEPILVRYSIEGSTLDRKDNKLLSSVARRVACTLKPCNRSCHSGILADPNAPKGFKKPATDDELLAEIATEKFEHPGYTKLNGWTEVVADSILKADAAPSALTGQAALATEHLDKPALLEKAKGLLARFLKGEDSDFRAFMKFHLPEADPDFLQRFSEMVDDHQFKKAEQSPPQKARHPRRVWLAGHPDFQPEHVLVQKFQRLEESLRKALGQKPPKLAPVEFGGKVQHPGLGRMKGVNYLLLHADPQHFYAVRQGYDHTNPSNLVKIPRHAEGDSLMVVQHPQDLSVPSFVHADQHGVNLDTEQASLVHGMDLAGPVLTPPEKAARGSANAKTSTWRPAGNQKPAYVKSPPLAPELKGFSEAQREGLYYSLARNVFGLGHYLPITAVIRHPRTLAYHSVTEQVPEFEHVELKPQRSGKWRNLPAEHQLQVLRELGDKGDLDKLALMNMVLGNNDRHDENYVFTSAEPRLKLIDHGLTMLREFHPNLPRYLEHYAKHLDNQQPKGAGPEHYLDTQLHPEAHQWGLALSAQKLRDEMVRHGLPTEHQYMPLLRLGMLKEHLLRHNTTTRRAAFRSPIESE